MTTFRLSLSARNAIASRLASLMNGGSICIYDGDQPASGSETVRDQTLLARVEVAERAFPESKNGTIRADSIAPGKAAADGRASWARIKDAAGNTVFDCDVGEETDETTIRINTVNIKTNGQVAITDFAIVVPG